MNRIVSVVVALVLVLCTVSSMCGCSSRTDVYNTTLAQVIAPIEQQSPSWRKQLYENVFFNCFIYDGSLFINEVWNRRMMNMKFHMTMTNLTSDSFTEVVLIRSVTSKCLYSNTLLQISFICDSSECKQFEESGGLIYLMGQVVNMSVYTISNDSALIKVELSPQSIKYIDSQYTNGIKTKYTTSLSRI